MDKENIELIKDILHRIRIDELMRNTRISKDTAESHKDNCQIKIALYKCCMNMYNK